MLQCAGQWCAMMAVSLMALSLVTSMPSTSIPSTAATTSITPVSTVTVTTSRYRSVDGTIRSATSAGSSSESKSIALGQEALNVSAVVSSFTHILPLSNTSRVRTTMTTSRSANHVANFNKLKKRKVLPGKRKPEAVTSGRPLTSSNNITRPKPTIFKETANKLKVTRPKPDLEKFKQSTNVNLASKQSDFVLYHIPSVDPMPEVISYSPQYTFEEPLGSSPQLDSPIDNIVPISAVETSSNGLPAFEPDDAGVGEVLDIPLGTVDLDLVPEGQSNSAQFYDAAGNLCPSYHLTSNVYAPNVQGRQSNCPDLNVVLNSHYHPSYDTRRPETEAVEAAAGAGTAPLADVPAAAIPAAAAPAAGGIPAAAAPGAGGGSGGFFPPLGAPSLPEFPSLPQLSLPDLSGLGPIISGAWSGLSALFRFIWPILVAIPVIVFVKTLVATFFALFPWWFPALFLVARYDNGKEEKKHHFYKHVHKPVVHTHGWYWNHDSKTWSNVMDKGNHGNERSFDILKAIDEFKTSFRTTNASPISDTLKQLANQLMSMNATSHITFDTRTPPKFREQVRRGEGQHQAGELSHPGVAEAVDDEELVLEEEQKKMHFYKVDKPTTNSGISTWILLSGQSSTNKPTKKPAAITKDSANTEDKLVKPIFKRKSTTTTTTPLPGSSLIPSIIIKKSTTLAPSSTLGLKTTGATTGLSTDKPEKSTKLTKVANNASKKVTSRATTLKPSKTTLALVSGTHESTSETSSRAPTVSSKPDLIKVPINTSSDLQPEAKEGVLDLSSPAIDKKTKRPTSLTTTTIKRKKNKNRKKKPMAEEKTDLVNGTKISNKLKEKPFGTQIYNYLSREVMPTVGVGLVGLMVTAGLASYFLYPFGALRRSYEVDRKDKEGAYYYTDEYSGGISEEEAIGKVIAGMPASNYFNTNSRVHNSRNTYGLNDNNFNNMVGSYGDSYHPSRFRNVDQRYMEGSVPMNPYHPDEDIDVIRGTPKVNHNSNIYNNHKDSYEPYKATQVSEPMPSHEHITNENLSVTPAVVPEHGPRTIEEEEAAEEFEASTERTHERVFVVNSKPTHADALHSLEHGPRRRRRRQADKKGGGKLDKDIDNEIMSVLKETSSVHSGSHDLHLPIATTISSSTHEDGVSSTVESTTSLFEEDYTSAYPMAEKSESIFSLIRDLIYLKLRYSLQILQNKAESLSRYFRTVQERVDSLHAYHSNVNQTISYS